MTSVSPAWEFPVDVHLLKLQRLQNNVLRTTGKFLRFTPVPDLHVSFQVPHIYDYAKLCRQLAEVTQNHENANVRDIGKGEP
jgi:hypothetical protein